MLYVTEYHKIIPWANIFLWYIYTSGLSKYIYMHSCMLNMRLRHIRLPTNDNLLWDNLTTVHSMYNYANIYKHQQSIAFATCLISGLNIKCIKEKHRDDQKILQQHKQYCWFLDFLSVIDRILEAEEMRKCLMCIESKLFYIRGYCNFIKNVKHKSYPNW